jgi:putative transposase
MRFSILLQVLLCAHVTPTQKDKTNKSFEPIPKRWVIERTFAWFDNDRRMCRNYELLMETAEEIVKISATQFLLNKI